MVFRTSIGTESRLTCFLAFINLNPNSSKSKRFNRACNVLPITYFLNDETFMKHTKVEILYFCSRDAGSNFFFIGVIFVFLGFYEIEVA